MFSRHQRLRRSTIIFLVASTCLGLSGCIPTAWLPDSSGFVYVKPLKAKNPGDPGSGQLLQYDLKTKASRIIVADIAATTLRPAVSPDGKRVAMARFKGEPRTKEAPKSAKTVQVTIFDMQGKQVQQSKEMAWTGPEEDNIIGSIGMLFWSPKDDKIVVTDMTATGIYDVRTDSIKMFEKALPAVYGGTPIRPDGKGFLLAVGNKDKAKKGRFVFMDWAGAEQLIDITALEKLLAAGGKAKDDEDPLGVAMMGLFLPSGWNGSTAWAGFKRMKWLCEIDTAAKSVSVTEAFAKVLAEKKDNQDKEPFRYDFAGDVSVHIVQFKDASPKGQKDFSKVVIVNHKTGKEEIVLAKIAGAYLCSPSPDGNYLTIGIGEMFGGIGGAQPEPMQILVIGSNGQLHSKIMLD